MNWLSITAKTKKPFMWLFKARFTMLLPLGYGRMGSIMNIGPGRI
jgi:hypothetical protein